MIDHWYPLEVVYERDKDILYSGNYQSNQPANSSCSNVSGQMLINIAHFQLGNRGKKIEKKMRDHDRTHNIIEMRLCARSSCACCACVCAAIPSAENGRTKF